MELGDGLEQAAYSDADDGNSASQIFTFMHRFAQMKRKNTVDAR